MWRWERPLTWSGFNCPFELVELVFHYVRSDMYSFLTHSHTIHYLILNFLSPLVSFQLSLNIRLQYLPNIMHKYTNKCLFEAMPFGSSRSYFDSRALGLSGVAHNKRATNSPALALCKVWINITASLSLTLRLEVLYIPATITIDSMAAEMSKLAGKTRLCDLSRIPQLSLV